MGRVVDRLRELDIELPAPETPVANYLGSKRSGDLLFVSARVSGLRGEVGSEVTRYEAHAAARATIVSLLAIIWLYIDTRSVEKVSTLATSILWFIVPSLSLFILLPLLLRKGVTFFPALAAAVLVMIAAYLATAGIAHRFGVTL